MMIVVLMIMVVVVTVVAMIVRREKQTRQGNQYPQAYRNHLAFIEFVVVG